MVPIGLLVAASFAVNAPLVLSSCYYSAHFIVIVRGGFYTGHLSDSTLYKIRKLTLATTEHALHAIQDTHRCCRQL